MPAPEQVASDCVVSIHYTLTDEEGHELDSSAGGATPLDYLHGHSQILPALEEALEGLAVGDEAKVVVSPELGYGPREAERVISVSASAFDFEVKPGEVVQAQHKSGDSHHFLVVAVDDDTVTLDGNHPLAGKTLNFAVQVVALREANAEELASGHAQA